MRFKNGEWAEVEDRFFLLAEGDGDATGAGGPDAEAEAAAAAAAQPEPTWRDGITDPEARKLADDSTDLTHLAKRALEMRQKLSTSIVIPGKDAAEEDVAAYRKALGVPNTVEGYEFPVVPEEQLTDEVKASRAEWAATFHQHNVPKAVADNLIAKFSEDSAKAELARLDADAAYTAAQSKALHDEWGTEYDMHETFANRAVAKVLGADFEEARHIEDKHGNFVLDNSILIKAFARLGKEMGEKELGAVIDTTQRETLQDQAQELRNKANEAHARGDQATANKLSEQERQIYSRLDASAVVGSSERSV